MAGNCLCREHAGIGYSGKGRRGAAGGQAGILSGDKRLRRQDELVAASGMGHQLPSAWPRRVAAAHLAPDITASLIRALGAEVRNDAQRTDG